MAFGNDKQLRSFHYVPIHPDTLHAHTHARARTLLYSIESFLLAKGRAPEIRARSFISLLFFPPSPVHSPAAFLRASSFCNQLPPLASSSSSSCRLPQVDVITYDHSRPSKRDGNMVHAYTFGSIHLGPHPSSVERD